LRPDEPDSTRTGTVALSDRPTQPAPLACPEAKLEAFICPVYPGFAGCLRVLASLLGASRGRSSPQCNSALRTPQASWCTDRDACALFDDLLVVVAEEITGRWERSELPNRSSVGWPAQRVGSGMTSSSTIRRLSTRCYSPAAVRSSVIAEGGKLVTALEGPAPHHTAARDTTRLRLRRRDRLGKLIHEYAHVARRG
jgi:hypothetical protein